MLIVVGDNEGERKPVDSAISLILVVEGELTSLWCPAEDELECALVYDQYSLYW